MNVAQHELKNKVCVVNITDFDATKDLGAPFKIFLSNGVTRETDTAGKTKVMIPDLTGLFKAVVQSRVLHPRKLSGPELKFVRRVVGLQAKSVARKMDVTAEHLSRCEAGTKVLSGSSEKIFRILAFVGSFCPDPQSILATIDAEKKEKKERKPPCPECSEKMNKLLISFTSMDIKSAFSSTDPLIFKFCVDYDSDELCINDDEDKTWEPCPEPAKAA